MYALLKKKKVHFFVKDLDTEKLMQLTKIFKFLNQQFFDCKTLLNFLVKEMVMRVMQFNYECLSRLMVFPLETLS